MWKILERNELGVVASPFRQSLLDALATPDSASNLARQLGTSRQRIGYHMRALEKAGFLELVEERKQRGCTEQLYRAKRVSYVLEPDGVVADEAAADALKKTRDRFSWSALMGIAVRMLRELTSLRRRADAGGKRLPTLGMETAIAFRNPRDRKAFTDELTGAVEQIVAKYHADNVPDARKYRLVLGAYPYVESVQKEERTS